MDAKQRFFTHQTVFALISTIFVPQHWNFTQRSTIHRSFFRLLSTNVQKCIEILLFSRQRETLFYSELLYESLRRKKSNISKHFWTLVNKRRKFLLCIVNLCVKFQCWGTNIVEMRAKTVWCVKNRRFASIFLPPDFFTKKHVILSTFPNTPRQFVCALLNLKPVFKPKKKTPCKSHQYWAPPEGPD